MLTTDQKQQVRDLYDYGFAVEEIAEHLGLDETDVLDYVDAIEQGNADDESEPDFEL